MPEQESLDNIKWALRALSAKAEDYRLFDAYMSGQHRLDYVPSELRSEFTALLRRARLNMCPAVVTSVRDRLKLTGFTPTTKGPEDALEEIWRDNRMDMRAGQLHKYGLTFGEAYAVVWPDSEGLPVIYPNSPRLVVHRPVEERPERVEVAAKCWQEEDKRVRLNLYYPDRIEKYITRGQSQAGAEIKAEAFVDFDDEEGGSILPNPYGRVPVFYFPNGSDAVSELSEAIPVQDNLNKTVRDMILGGENMALPQRYATGVEVPVDSETGRPVNLFAPGDLWATGSKEAKFGQMEAANLTQLREVKRSYIEDMSIVTGTPAHYFMPGGGTPPSGESLKTLEARLTAKVYDRQVSFGSSWEEVFQFCLRICGIEAELDALWEDTTPRNEMDVLNMAVTAVEKLGGSKRQAWRERGWSEKEIDGIFKEAASEDVVATTEM